MTTLPLVAVTLGDAAGIGPEIIARAMNDSTLQQYCVPLVIGHPRILQQSGQLFRDTTDYVPLESLPTTPRELKDTCLDAARAGRILCWNPAGDDVLNAPRRQVSAFAGNAAYRYLKEAIHLTKRGFCNAIATAPLNKESLHQAGHHFPGHTEILAAECNVSHFGMMLYLAESKLRPLRSLIQPATHAPYQTSNTASKTVSAAGDAPGGTTGLSIVHVTLHTSISSVPQLLTIAAVQEKTELMSEFLRRLGCPRQAIAVCALNPHGGENGLFGDEELRVIQPAVQLSRQRGLKVTGPLPVDTLMRRAILGEFDGVVAMYHDQGHIPVKLIGFDAAVNITLGLPIVRTSPTHGTAFDRAWDPATPADASGMIEAIRMAAQLCDRTFTTAM